MLSTGVSGDRIDLRTLVYNDDDDGDEADDASIRSLNYLQIVRVAVHRRHRPILSIFFFALVATPIAGVASARAGGFQLRENNKRDKREDTKSFEFPISGEGAKRELGPNVTSTTAVTFSRRYR